MAVDSPSATVRRSNKLGAMRSSDDEAKALTKGKATQHGGASSLAKALAVAGTAALLCAAAVKVSSASSSHPGHAQLKALITDGKWRHAEIDHLYELGDSMQEAIGLVSCFFFLLSFSLPSRPFFSPLAHSRPKKKKLLRQDVTEGHTGTAYLLRKMQVALARMPAVKTICEIGFNSGHSASVWLAVRRFFEPFFSHFFFSGF